ncbi:MAG: pilus assembly protein [Pseudomonadota bacterium]
MKTTIRQSVLIQSMGLAIAGCGLGYAIPALAERAIPDVPLITNQNATPMTMLVSGKDHRFFYEAYNDASDINGDGVIDYKFNPAITYYGLFDSNLCYTHSGGADNTDKFTPADAASKGKCPGKWSGNWLNYATTSRIDALRKVLYGGYREVDSDSQTVLRRAFIPQEAHSWAKEYTSRRVDGYKISDYTPLEQPEDGKRHFFGNLTFMGGTDKDPPLLSVVTNSTKRVWEWASTERPVLTDSTHGGTRSNYTVRLDVCTKDYHDGCKQYPNGSYKPVGLLHDYGENESMLFGLLTGSYEKNTSGGVLRKVMSSFKDEVNQTNGQFTDQAAIVQSFNALRIRGFTNWDVYGGGWVVDRPMKDGEFVDWGNPIAEMMYETLRYFAGKEKATSEYSAADSGSGLPVATWDNPYDTTKSAAKAQWCAKASMLTISDINVSFDSDQLPGSYFGSFSGDLEGLNVQTEAATITENEPDASGLHFIGQSGSAYDSAPSPKNVTSLGTIRGLAPEEPTKQGSYYAASVAYFGQRSDLNAAKGAQSVSTLAVALASPLPRIEVPIGDGKITLVPFAKSVGGFGITSGKTTFQPTNQIVDFYVEQIANSGAADRDKSVNGGRYYAKFRINYEDVEQGADHDMDAIAEYEISAQKDGTLKVLVTPTYQAGGMYQNMGYIISGSSRDGVYLVVQDEDVEVPYYLNTPPGRDPGYCDQPTIPDDCKKLPYLKGPEGLNKSERIFSPGNSAATLLQDPLWYAAKWGGFMDANKNGKPDKTSEWDNDGADGKADGVPDTYFLVQNPTKLKESLKKSLDAIISRSASGGAVSANSQSIQTDSLVFQATFSSAKWSGELYAYGITSDGINTAEPKWRASMNIPKASDRDVITTKDGGKIPFTWSNLSESQQTSLGSADVLDYLRGDRSKEPKLRERASALGDIVNSAPYYAADIDTVFVGANDGMLHAFNAKDGTERFAYVPGLIFGKLHELAKTSYSHKYFVDGDIAVSTKEQTGDTRYLVGAPGRGGKGFFALDVSNTSKPKVLLEYSGDTDSNIGYVLGRPQFAKFNDGKVYAVFGNGYNSTNGKAVLYVLDLENLKTTAIDTGTSGDNGLATPGLFDKNKDGKIDAIYAGDLKGNVWKFDTESGGPKEWPIAYGGKPLFTAISPDKKPQPITAPITVIRNSVMSSPTVGKAYVFFGTGSYIFSDDPANKATQSWYGLIDDGSVISAREQLVERVIEVNGTVTDQTGKKKSARSFSEPSTQEQDDPKKFWASKRGWYLDLVEKGASPRGERMVTRSNYYYLREPVLLASSIIPTDDPCQPGGTGYINAINPFTGARLKYVAFDVYQDGKFDGKDNVMVDVVTSSLDIGIGMPGESIIIGGKLITGGTGNEESSSVGAGGDAGGNGTTDNRDLNQGAATGRISWHEIVTQ